MNFFRSVFSDDSDHPSSSSSSTTADPQIDAASPPTTAAAAWSLGGLITTVAARSESVISTVRRDLEEFGSGLKKETETLTRAVADLDLPAVVSNDSIGKIISHGAESILRPDQDPDYSSSSDSGVVRDGDEGLSRFERKLRVIQGDVRGYVEEPEETEEYGRWKLGFDLGEKREEIEGLMRGNEIVAGIYRKVVGSEGVVDHEMFWCRYFYRVERLRLAEFVRAKLVKRAMRDEDDEEELSWDVEDDEEVKENNASSGDADNAEKGNLLMGDVVSANADDAKGEETNASSADVDNADSGNSSLLEVTNVSEGVRSGYNGEEVVMLDEKVGSKVSEMVINDDEMSKGPVGEVAIEEKHGHSEASIRKDADVVVMSNHTAPDEEDIGWDEIEDVESGDEKKVSMKPSGSHDRAELWKQQSATDEVEDLSWDIEDDDEPVKV